MAHYVELGSRPGQTINDKKTDVITSMKSGNGESVELHSCVHRTEEVLEQ